MISSVVNENCNIIIKHIPSNSIPIYIFQLTIKIIYNLKIEYIGIFHNIQQLVVIIIEKNTIYK